jgi:hypothetical protein
METYFCLKEREREHRIDSHCRRRILCAGRPCVTEHARGSRPGASSASSEIETVRFAFAATATQRVEASRSRNKTNPSHQLCGYGQLPRSLALIRNARASSGRGASRVRARRALMHGSSVIRDCRCRDVIVRRTGAGTIDGCTVDEHGGFLPPFSFGIDMATCLIELIWRELSAVPH